MPEHLNQQAIADNLASLPGWSQAGDAICKSYSFKNFAAAIGFINAVAICAEKADHHPDLFLHGWNKVDVTLSTHSANGITQNDFDLASAIELLV